MDFHREIIAFISFLVGIMLCFLLCFAFFPTGKTDKTGSTPEPTPISTPKTVVIDYEYTIENNEVTIKKYVGDETEVIIPSEINGNEVTSIGVNAFLNSSIKSITIPDSVTSIGGYALGGAETFNNCTGLTSIVIPASVTVIFSEAFKNCRNLRSVYFEGNAPEVIEWVDDWNVNTVHARASDTFEGAADDFKIYYKKGTTGWTNPWNGYATEEY